MNSTIDNKHRIRNPKKNSCTNPTLFPYPSDNLLYTSFLAGGGYLSMPPPSLSRSYPAPIPVFLPPHNLQSQPPLLPLPINHHQNMKNNNIRLSPPQVNKNFKNRGRDHSVTPKKSKNLKKNSKKEVLDGLDIPQEVVNTRVFSSLINKSCDTECVDVFDDFSCSTVFGPSPPPSSLPLPTFSVRSKAGCKAEVSSVDVGATDSLRRINLDV